MKAMKTVMSAMTRTKEMTVMVPMKMSSCLICSSEITFSCSCTTSLLANKELLRGPPSMMTGHCKDSAAKNQDEECQVEARPT